MAEFLGCARNYSIDLIRIGRIDGNGNPLPKPTYAAYASFERALSGTWTRAADEPSSATVVLEPGCWEAASEVLHNIGAYDLRINRDGVAVWEGPITRVGGPVRDGAVTIEAGDVMWWVDELQIFNNREENQCFNYTARDPGFLARTAIQRPLTGTQWYDRKFSTKDFPYMLDFAVWNDNIGVDIDYKNCDADLTVGDVLDDLVKYGLTWTVIGRSVFIGGRPKPGTPPLAQLTSDDFDEPLEIEADLNDLATQVFAISQTCRKVPCRYSNGPDHATHPGDLQENYAGPYGYRDLILDVGYGPAGDPGWTAMRNAACAAQAGRGRVKPVILADSPAQLVGDAGIGIDELVPGLAVVSLAVDDRVAVVDDDFVIEAVEVSWDTSDHGETTESVSVGFIGLADFYSAGQVGYVSDRQRDRAKPTAVARKSAARKRRKESRKAAKRTWCDG